jgi:L-rhamnose-H+ transport protein
MIYSNPILGTGLHAIGGASASTCYLPFHKTKQWSWESFCLVQATFAWVIMPIVVGYFTVPDFFTILSHAPSAAFWGAFLLGAIYGFGGMAFGMSIQNIGYSLTYTIAIGISAILGTVTPLLLKGQLIEYFMRAGSWIVLGGMVLSIIGVALCGWAGFRKETDLRETKNNTKFNMKIGLSLAVFAGLLSAVFNLSLEFGQPIADMAAQNGAGNFEGNAKMIVSTSGCFVVNFIWFLILGIKNKTLKEFTKISGLSAGLRSKNFLWSALAGTLWCGQFFFYGLGHVQMGSFQFISWVLHMSMLIFFSYIVGVMMKEWKTVSKPTYNTLIIALLILVTSFVIMSYGSYYGENMITQH